MSIFGQNPADITGALFKAKNLDDLPDKTAARANLNVPSVEDVQYNSVPIGMILPYWGNTAPAGYLPCHGQTITSGVFPGLVTFLGGTTSAVVPDLRGEFLRGWDNGRGVDPGREIRTSQLDAIQNIVGSLITRSGGASTVGSIIGGGPNNVFDQTSLQTGQTGVSQTIPDGAAARADVTVFNAARVVRTAAETRPRNAAVLYCIKAYNAVQNFTSGINIAGLAGDYASLVTSAVKYADFQGVNQVLSTGASGYQKLPGGLIIQWGRLVFNSAGVQVFAHPVTFPTGVLASSTNIIDSVIYDWTSKPYTTSVSTVGSTSVYSGYTTMSVVSVIVIGY